MPEHRVGWYKGRMRGLSSILAALLSVGCINSLHLDPTGGAGGAGGGATGGQGGGGAPPSACESNTDCALPTAICDQVKGLCVECLTYADCGFKPGTLCSLGQCVCAEAGQSYCEAIDFPAPTTDQAAGCYALDTSSNCGQCGKRCLGSCDAGACTGDWIPTALVGAPTGRAQHVAVSTGSQMIVWGGNTTSGFTNTGGIYDPATDAWTATSETGAPSGRVSTSAVWTGSKMIVWGGSGVTGQVNSGGVFDPATNAWSPTATLGALSPREFAASVWIPTISKMFVYGGRVGGTVLSDAALYDPASNTWSTIAAAPDARQGASAVWDGGKVIVYGGQAPNGSYLSDVMTYDMTSWSVPDPTGQPGGRNQHAAFWDGSGMVVFGGFDGGPLSTGGRWSNGWSSMAPPPGLPRYGFASAFAMNKMWVFGGQGPSGALDDGFFYSAPTNTWGSLPLGPGARSATTGVIVGTKFIVWGGNAAGGPTAEGAMYTIN